MTAALLTALLLAAAPLTEAETQTAAPGPWSTGPRLRFGLGYWANSPVMIGGTMHAGVQLNERLALYALGFGGMGLGAANLTGGLVAELSLLDWLSFGAGIGASSSAAQGGAGSMSNPLALGAPLRLALSFGPPAPLGDYRQRGFFAVEGFAGAGVKPSQFGQFAWSLGLALGWQLM